MQNQDIYSDGIPQSCRRTHSVFFIPEIHLSGQVMFYSSRTPPGSGSVQAAIVFSSVDR